MIVIEYLVLFISLLILFFIYNKLAVIYNIVDVPNIRSSHSQITIRGGGIIFTISILLWFIKSGFQYPWFITGLIVISIISFLDDLFQISFQNRLIVHLLSLSLLCIQLELYQYQWWIWIPVLIVLTGIINAFNFMDGINGITGGYSLAVLLGLWIVNNFQVTFVANELIYYITLAVVIFNYFNFRKKARCFAGDVGSISIAYIIVFLLAKLILQTGNFLYLLFLAVYGVDTLYTIIFRLTQKENIFEPHRKHLYQLLANEYKISHTHISIIYSVVQIIISLIIIIISFRNLSLTNSLTIGLILLLIMTLVFHFARVYIHKKDNYLHNVSTN
ncbi:MAG TPA: glycosyltransferase family 4 protein [Ignavibacteriaceae bacterium]|nr:glycosyltransferase family 4 protein [Ignavibacteriaceae bacterium]